MNNLILRTATLVSLLLTLNSYANGNFPDAASCPKDKPYFAVCTSSVHDLLGWTGQCRATKQEAQKDAEQHAKDVHNGDTRWTGYSHTRK